MTTVEGKVGINETNPSTTNVTAPSSSHQFITHHIMSSSQLQTIAPAPQGNPMGQPMGPPTPQGANQPTGHPIMSPGGQTMQQLPSGQFQVIQQPFPTAANPQYQMPQIATYNQQGQLVLQPANFAMAGMPQQPGHQYIITGMPQKSGGQPQLSSAGSAPTSKPMTPTISHQGYTLTSTGMVTATGTNGQQTFMIASPMGGIMTTGQPQLTASMPSQMKQENKPTAQSPANQQPQPPQQIMLPQGMAYMNPQQPGQAFIHNGQIVIRPQDGQPLMFSPPSQAIPQQALHQQMPTQPLQQLPVPPRPQTSMPSQSQLGKTSVSRSLAPILPQGVVTTMANMARQGGYSTGPQMSAPITQQASPKSKQKMSPRNSANNQRPQGPNKSALNVLKTSLPQSSLAGSPRLPGSPQGQPGSPRPPLGPPTLQASTLPSMPIIPGGNHGPPTLQPMINQLPVLPPATTASVTKAPSSSAPSIPSPLTTTSTSSQQPPLKKDTASSAVKSDKPRLPSPMKRSLDDILQDAPKQPVKQPPSVLTHIIDDHIIKESSHPFPVENDGRPGQPQQRKTAGKTETKKDSNAVNTEKKRGPGRPPGTNKQQQQQKLIVTNGDSNKGKPDPEETPEKKRKLDSDSKPEVPVSNILKNNPLKWSVQQVCDFVKALPGCSDYVEDFQLQEIDGQALMLLKADHLMSAMAIKLGPALKICASIDQMREELKQN